MCVYALVCPATHAVKYVGRTGNVRERYRAHCHGEASYTRDWVASIAPEKPVLVILETVQAIGSDIQREANACETKWIKRFRRTVINTRLRENDPSTWDALVNSQLPGGTPKC